MISWPENDITEPLLKYVFSDSLKEFIKKVSQTGPNRNVGPVIDLPRFSFLGQAVETAVKVTESAVKVCCSIAREEYIRKK